MSFTGIKKGGNPPDAGSAYLDGVRIAWIPASLIDRIGEDHFAVFVAFYHDKGEALNRDEVWTCWKDAEADDRGIYLARFDLAE